MHALDPAAEMPLMPPALTAPGLMQARLGPRAADPQRHAPHCLRSGPPSRSPRGLQRSARAGAQRLPGHWTPEAWVSPPSAASRPRCRERTWRSRPVRRSASPPSPPVPLCRCGRDGAHAMGCAGGGGAGVMGIGKPRAAKAAAVRDTGWVARQVGVRVERSKGRG